MTDRDVASTQEQREPWQSHSGCGTTLQEALSALLQEGLPIGDAA